MEIDLTPVGGGKVMRMEAFAVPEILQVHNEHLEIECRNYPHLAQIWLSNVCKNSEQLEIDLLIGADYLWTGLGWVVFGTLTYKQPAYRA